MGEHSIRRKEQGAYFAKVNAGRLWRSTMILLIEDEGE
jgi:hypothetical protein